MTDFKQFKGAAKPIDDIDLPKLGARLGVGEDEIHAFLDAETNGSGFDGRGRPKMLFEPHVFYRNLTGTQRSTAVNQGLAYPNWGQKPYPRESYSRLVKAMAINETAALRSASWGLAQVLGENHHLAGYDTPGDMVLAMMADEEHHLEAAVNFIKASKLDVALRAHDWDAFAKGYNGPKYKVHGYDVKLKKGFEKWSKIKDTPYDPADVEVPVPATKAPQQVSKIDLVAQVQQLLRDKGYPEVGNPDGIYGNRTRNAILAFQADNRMSLTGLATDDVLAALVKAPVRQNSQDRETATVKDLKELGIPTVQIGDKLQKIAIGVITASGLGGVFDGTASFEQITKGVASLREMTGAIMQLSPWIVGVGVGAVALYFARRVIAAQVEAYRKGHSV